MKRTSEIDNQSDISCTSIMDKFGLSSPTRAATAVRYRPSTSSASPSHLHLLRSHSNTSAADITWPERREDGDGKSCDSIATCVAGLVAVSETGTQSATMTATTTTAAVTTTTRQQASYHLFHHPYHHGAVAESDDEDDSELTERRRRRLRLAATTNTTTTTTADDNKLHHETFSSADSRSVSTSTVSSPLLHHHQQLEQGDEEAVTAATADVQSSISISTHPSFSQVILNTLLLYSHTSWWEGVGCSPISQAKQVFWARGGGGQCIAMYKVVNVIFMCSEVFL